LRRMDKISAVVVWEWHVSRSGANNKKTAWWKRAHNINFCMTKINNDISVRAPAGPLVHQWSLVSRLIM